MLLCAQSSSQQLLWAECSPLPGWSKESLAEAQEQLLSLKSGALSLDSPLLYPSVRFALSSLFLQNAHPFAESFSLPLCPLLQKEEEAEALQAAGFTHLKIKIGSLSLNQTLLLLRKLTPHFNIRLDANRKWPLKKMVALLAHFPDDQFDYIEEPVDHPEHLLDFPYPTALDESLQELSPDFLDQLPNLKALILKPTLLGGWKRCKEWQQFAAPRKIDIVLSSSFESGVGTMLLAYFANQLQLHATAVGLGPYRWIEQDLLCTPLAIQQGLLTIPASMTVNQTLLTPIHADASLISS